LSKCEFWLKEVSFLWHIISNGGVAVDPKKVKDVLSWNPPKDVRDTKFPWYGWLLPQIY
jgi:hypothetical protein